MNRKRKVSFWTYLELAGAICIEIVPALALVFLAVFLISQKI